MNRTVKFFIALFIVLCISLPAIAQNAPGRLKIVLRYDDYSKYTSMDLARQLADMARNAGGGLMIGVIPFPYGEHPDQFDAAAVPAILLSEQKIALLKKYLAEGAIEVALHGFSHRNHVPEGKGRHSEFSGLTEAQQTAVLQTAKASLEQALGSRVRAFVPPFNQYDHTTIRVLEMLGFELVSGGMRSFSNTRSTLKFMPGTVYVDKLAGVIDNALRAGHEDAVVVVTMHPYDIVESGEKMPAFRKDHHQMTLQAIKEDLDRIGKRPGVEFVSVTRLLDGSEDFSIARWKANLALKDSFITRHRLLPAALKLYPVQGLYYSEKTARRLLAEQKRMTLYLYGGLFLIATFLSWLLTRLLSYKYAKTRPALSTLSLLGLVAIAALFAVKGLHPLVLAAAACCLGVFTGAVAMRKSPPSTA